MFVLIIKQIFDLKKSNPKTELFIYQYVPEKVMVLESLISPITAERKPYEMFFIGALYSCIAIIASMLLFTEHVSIIIVFFIVLMCSRIMYKTIKIEEKKDFKYSSERKLLKEHSRALALFTFLFLGVAVCISLWYIFLPAETASTVFASQENSINIITGNAINPGYMLKDIFFNNLRLLCICIVFALMFGMGSIFIIAWNASVMGVVIGSFARNAIGGNYFATYSLGLLRYLTHGIPEIIAYFAAGLGAGIISIAIIRHDYRSKKFKHVLMDSAGLIMLSVVILMVAALIEVFITPIFF
ncbi:MAG: stage II sporulation protein M [Nanoarchaeota archaeon]|nr:stage II sporulation protein M [Nanoarchaeota archaeon]